MGPSGVRLKAWITRQPSFIKAISHSLSTKMEQTDPENIVNKCSVRHIFGNFRIGYLSKWTQIQKKNLTFQQRIFFFYSGNAYFQVMPRNCPRFTFDSWKNDFLPQMGLGLVSSILPQTALASYK